MYYFASDMHLGSGAHENPRERERALVAWLDRVAADARAIFLVGDVFDFWYEYKRVVPQGFTRLLGKFSELTDRGVEIHYFVGNHDMWQRDYLEMECGVKMHFKREVVELYGKRVSICHGDDIYARYLGGWTGLVNSLFRSRTARWLFSHLVHPDFALRFGLAWSKGSRKAKAVAMPFLGKEDPLVQEAEKIAHAEQVDYFVFGHNHCAETLTLEGGGEVVFLGHWFEGEVYASLDESGTMKLHK